MQTFFLFHPHEVTIDLRCICCICLFNYCLFNYCLCHCERPCVQINLSNIWWIPWRWTNLGALDFHYENGYRTTKMHLNTSQPMVPWNLAEHFSLSWPLFKFVENAFQPSFSERSLGERWNGFFYQRSTTQLEC